jgi:hypothetical protein
MCFFIISKSACPWQALSNLVYYFWMSRGTYPTVEHLKGASLRYVLALLGLKDLPRTNTLAYYVNSKIAFVKSFY